jgi:UDP-2,3-diacylglucosamine hydrolase
MSTLFISDLHLSPERPDIIRLFGGFLEHTASQAKALYILGDLFEVWIGDDFVPPGLDAVISELAKLTENGTPTYVMRGNRDFLLGNQFEAQTGCRLLDDHEVIELYGQPTLLMHGDLLCTDDVDYLKFRAMVRNPQWQEQFLAKSVQERIGMAKAARQESQTKTQQLANEIMDVNADTVANTMQQWNVQRLIHGHTHRPATHQLSVAGRPATRIVLGDWYEQGSVLRCTTDRCELENLPLR